MGANSMFESLESRRLLSGNVAVTVAGSPGDTIGTITINGDNKSNQIVITNNFDGYFITGQTGTTVNGQPSVFIDTGGHARNLAVSMGNGDDSVTDSADSNSVSIDGGNGNDTIAF